MSVDLLEALKERERKVTEYFMQPRFRDWFKPQDLRDAVFAYLERPAKRLRPAVMMWSCGAVGGDENLVIPAAAGIEIFHTWTLVHDDLIDNDELRRGGPTIHKLGEAFAREKLGYPEEKCRDYGRDLAVLTGDSQHGFTISLFCECAGAKTSPTPSFARRRDKNGSYPALSDGCDPSVVLDVIYHLESYVVNTLIEGETLDVQYARTPVEKLTCDDIVRMLWMKTGVLYEFAARAGAMLGLNTSDLTHPWVAALSRFASKCGTAFQLQDDILGLLGKEEQLGKPVGSDVREGKKTTIVYFALKTASEEQKKFLLSVLGNANASTNEVQKATQMMLSLGAVDQTAQLALEHVNSALTELDELPDSQYKELLRAWAKYMIERQF
ncbi:MAG: polyprenyl synthetase family protein [Armatimonadetes bacterium]|nr:polyprenyl synthetase family protein [Armatimonadota bacterium]